jgi:hypothetical protein
MLGPPAYAVPDMACQPGEPARQAIRDILRAYFDHRPDPS